MNPITEKRWSTLVYRDERATTHWRKSSYSGGGNDCVEIASAARGAGVRDSKSVRSGALWLTSEAWHELRRAAREQP